jgi:hypothetical protein
MGIETAEYSGKKMKESVNKEAAVGRGECNEQIQDTNSELLGLLHLHQVHSQHRRLLLLVFLQIFFRSKSYLCIDLVKSASLLAGYK